jgi:hypothetical protein
MIAEALQTNTTLHGVSNLMFVSAEGLYDVLGSLLFNSTLQSLQIERHGNCSWLSPLLLALQVNGGLKGLIVAGLKLNDEKLRYGKGVWAW